MNNKINTFQNEIIIEIRIFCKTRSYISILLSLILSFYPSFLLFFFPSILLSFYHHETDFIALWSQVQHTSIRYITDR